MSDVSLDQQADIVGGLARGRTIASVAWRHTPCRTEPDTWFGTDVLTVRWATQLCQSCPGLTACREVVDRLETGVTDPRSPRLEAGVWAGEAPHERARRRRQSSQPAEPRHAREDAPRIDAAHKATQSPNQAPHASQEPNK